MEVGSMWLAASVLAGLERVCKLADMTGCFPPWALLFSSEKENFG